jgi:hypothetical protein
MACFKPACTAGIEKGSGTGVGGVFETWTIQLGTKPVSKSKSLKGRLPGPRAALRNIRGDSCGGAPLKESVRMHPSFATPATGPCS